VAKLAKDFNIRTKTLTTVSRNKKKLNSLFFLPECVRKHDTVSGNSNERILSTLPGFGIEQKIHFRNNLLQVGYNDSSPITTLFLLSHLVMLQEYRASLLYIFLWN